MKLYQRLASLVQARHNCLVSDNVEWRDKHEETILNLVKEHMPSGSGWDCGTEILLSASTGEKLVFKGSYHHMDQHGGYNGWTEHHLAITPSLANGFDLKVSGRNRNDIKEHLSDLFYHALETEVPIEHEQEPLRDDQCAGGDALIPASAWAERSKS